MANLYQKTGEREHTNAIVTVSTNLHGKLDGVGSFGPLVVGEAEYKDLFDLGSAAPTAVTAASSKREDITMKLRSSKLAAFIETLRTAYSLPEDARKNLHNLGLRIIFTVTKAPFDENNDPLPVEVKDVEAIYAGAKESIDRGEGAEAIYYDVKLHPTTDAELR